MFVSLQSFILTNLDSYMVDLNEIPDLMANVSTLHMTKPDDVGWKDINMDVGNYSIRVLILLKIYNNTS